MLSKRTDLALEAHELWRQAAQEESLPGLRTGESTCRGCTVTAVEITDDAAAHALGKPQGRYLTLDLAPLRTQAETALSDTAQALGGWTTPDMLLRVYGHSVPDKVLSSGGYMDRLLAGETA